MLFLVPGNDGRAQKTFRVRILPLRVCRPIDPLLPAAPHSILLARAVAQLSADSETGALKGKFEFANNNFYSVVWENPDVDLYWLPHNEQLLTQNCFGAGGTANDACAFYQDGMCAVKVAEFSAEESFETAMRTTIERQLVSTQTSQDLACSMNMLLSQAVNGNQRMLANGTAHASSPLRDFGQVDVSDVYYYFSN